MDILNEQAFHGTTKRNETLIRTQGFADSTKDNEWLGHGVYFFRYRANADWWAAMQAKRKSDSPAVIPVSLTYSEKNHLDLDDFAQLKSFSEFIHNVMNVLENKKGLNNVFSKNEQAFWSWSCNMYRKAHENIYITSYTFARPNRNFIYPERSRQHCVSNKEIISILP